MTDGSGPRLGKPKSAACYRVLTHHPLLHAPSHPERVARRHLRPTQSKHFCLFCLNLLDWKFKGFSNLCIDNCANGSPL